MQEFRCPSRKHFILYDHIVETKCQSKHCGAGSGVIVLHYFNLRTGALVRTTKLQDPAKYLEGKEVQSAAQHNSAAVRSA